MLLLEVLLDVKCCGCGQRMAVTVRCEGDSDSDDATFAGANALFSLECTACSQQNHVVFAPETGEVVEVMDQLRVLRMPEPSLN